MTEENTILEVENLAVEFDGLRVLEDVNFSIKKGEVLAVVGPNGAGKSVMFRALLDLIPYTGKISWRDGVKIGYVPQKLSIERTIPLTIKEFLSLKAVDGEKTKDEIIAALNSVGIKTDSANEYHLGHHILNRPLGKLSGGEFQRILIAWAMVGKPDVLLFDEPTAGIDLGGEETIYNLLHRLQTSANLTIILISHDLNIVYQNADKVICLNKKPICFGKPSLVLDPVSLSAIYGGEAKFFQHEPPNN